MVSLILAAAFFVGIHVCISGTGIRDAVVRRTGERGFQGLFSLLSIGAMVWLVQAYRAAPFIEVWGRLHALKPAALVVMLAASLLVVLGLTTPSPTSVGGEAQLASGVPAQGILRITRHPFLWSVALWGFAHLVITGDAASTVLFGSLMLLALIGPRSIDAKRRRRLGSTWERFAQTTSNVPFAAILQGRNTLRLEELGWWRLALAVGVYGSLLLGHRWLFGVSPLPW
jgi:uncharacterized membrane protein